MTSRVFLDSLPPSTWCVHQPIQRLLRNCLHQCFKPSACASLTTGSQCTSRFQSEACRNAAFASALNTRNLCQPATPRNSCRPRRDTVGDAMGCTPNCGSVSSKTTNSKLEVGFSCEITHLMRTNAVECAPERVVASSAASLTKQLISDRLARITSHFSSAVSARTRNSPRPCRTMPVPDTPLRETRPSGLHLFERRKLHLDNFVL